MLFRYYSASSVWVFRRYITV